MKEEKAINFCSQMWIDIFPEKRTSKYNNEIYIKEYWAMHLVWNIFKQKLAKRRENELRRIELNTNFNGKR